MVLSPKTGERSFKGKALRRCMAVKTHHIQGSSWLQHHCSSSRAGLQPGSRTLSHSALGGGQHTSTKPTNLTSVLPLTFMRGALHSYCHLYNQETTITHLREPSIYKLIPPVRVCARVSICPFVWSEAMAQRSCTVVSEQC